MSTSDQSPFWGMLSIYVEDKAGNLHSLIETMGPIATLGVGDERNIRETDYSTQWLFEGPEVFRKNPQILTDYSKSSSKSKTLNHLDTFRVIQQLSLVVPYSRRLVVQWERLLLSNPVAMTLDEVADGFLQYVDKLTPYFFRSSPFSLLSEAQQAAKTDSARMSLILGGFCSVFAGLLSGGSLLFLAISIYSIFFSLMA